MPPPESGGSIIAGPSWASTALVGLKVIEDDPDAVVVVIFPDNAFKYASTFERHFPQYRAARADEGGAIGEPSAKEQLSAPWSRTRAARTP